MTWLVYGEIAFAALVGILFTARPPRPSPRGHPLFPALVAHASRIEETDMSNLEMWSALIGAVLPALVATVNRSHWLAWLKGLVAIASSIVASGVTAWLTGDLSGKTWTTSALIVATAALGSYKLWWRPTGIAPAIERATTPKE